MLRMLALCLGSSFAAEEPTPDVVIYGGTSAGVIAGPTGSSVEVIAMPIR